MSTISAKDVANLRARTGLPMMDCKQALTEANGDFEKATDILRIKMKGKMDERTDRAASEGVLALASGAGEVAMIEFSTETDFTAKNEATVAAAQAIAKIALAGSAGKVALNPQITAEVDKIRIATGENVSYARGIKVAGAHIGTYLHHNRQIGVIIVADGALSDEIKTGICQHVTAAVPTPLAIDEAGLPADRLAKVRSDAQAEAAASGKPANIAEKMAEGKVRKWIGENTLLGQSYVKDDSKTIAQILPAGVKILSFHRYKVGTGK